jgi:hypothetical protein
MRKKPHMSHDSTPIAGEKRAGIDPNPRQNSKLVEHQPKETEMADAPKKESQVNNNASGAPAPGKPNKPAGMGIRLAPVDNSDQPVVANYAALNISPGMVFVDFGFLEPGMLAALPRVAKEGGKLPERLNGKLAVRVAMGYDAVANLQQQLGRVLAGLNASAEKGRKGGG